MCIHNFRQQELRLIIKYSHSELYSSFPLMFATKHSKAREAQEYLTTKGKKDNR